MGVNRDHPYRDHTGRFLRTLRGAQRDAEAVRLRSEGQSYQQISDALKFGSRSNARRAVERALVDTIREPAEEARLLQLEQLDRLGREATAVLEREHPLVSRGQVVLGEDGRPLLDYRPTLAAIDSLLRIQERRAKLLALDAPTRHHVLTLDAIDAEIAQLTDELGRAGDG